MTAKIYTKNFPLLTDPAEGTYAWNFTINRELDKAIDHWFEHRLSYPLAQDFNRISDASLYLVQSDLPGPAGC